MSQQALEGTASFVIQVEQNHMRQRVDATTT